MSSPQPSSRPSILIVDDDPVTLELMREELQQLPVRLQVLGDPLRAAELLRLRDFDLLITDISMPGMSGLDLAATAWRRSKSRRLILVSGSGGREELAQALMLGAFDYVEKPFRPGELAEVVRRCLWGTDETLQLYARAAEAMELTHQVRQAALDSVRALVRAVEAKDPHTCRHSEHVAHYALHLAGEMQLAAEEVESIRVAALLHDVGKIGVPDFVLTKPGRLTEDEARQMRLHPVMGAEILANVTLFGREATFVRHHHERWDGQGYPDHLTGEESPLCSRIIQVSDCMDAMLSARYYKHAFPLPRMLDELARGSGSQFDPSLAAAAIAWCRDNPDRIIAPATLVAVP